MANYHDIQHRFANKQAGKNGRICSSNVRYEGRNYYSYGTVFGQWLDIEKNVVAIFDDSTSISSSKHKLGKWCFPDDVHVFPLDFGGCWRNCNLVSSYNFNDEDFKVYHRMQMVDHYIERIYNQLESINGGTKKGLENVDFKAWGYVEELCGLYKDTSIAKYLKWTKQRTFDDNIIRKRKLVKLLKAGERNVETLTDTLFGKGTFKAYWDYCARFRKAYDNKMKMLAICNRLGIKNPYKDGYWDEAWKATLSVDEVRKLSPAERNEVHFASLMRKEEWYARKDRETRRERSKYNAYKWIVGFQPVMRNPYFHEYEPVMRCRNMYTGEVYYMPSVTVYGFYWAEWNVKFRYEEFAEAEDKEAWIRSFYDLCKEVQDNLKAYKIMNDIGAHMAVKRHCYDESRFLDDDYLRNNTSEEEYALCKKFIDKQDKYFADQEARRRAADIARLKREEEERKEREYQATVKQEQIVECLKDGSEGCRNLWRKHLSNLYDSEASFNDASLVDKDGDFFYGGNVLLRLNLNKDKVETSKSICMPIEVAKKFFLIIKRWHENPSCFKPMQIDTKGSGKYTISSYEDDILTAGCHKIAYTEMERMYDEIININA